MSETKTNKFNIGDIVNINNPFGAVILAKVKSFQPIYNDYLYDCTNLNNEYIFSEYEGDLELVDNMSSIESIAEFNTAIELLNLYKENRLLMLPCKFGDNVYFLQKCQVACDKCKQYIETDDNVKCFKRFNSRIFKVKFDCSMIDMLNKTIFVNFESAYNQMKNNHKLS